jgi:predicted amidohydrolase YtcJ
MMPPTADLIVENASVLTTDPDTPRAGAVAIEGNDIIAIADRATVLEHKATARVIDAQRLRRARPH